MGELGSVAVGVLFVMTRRVITILLCGTEAYPLSSRMGHGVNLHAAFIHDESAYCWVSILQDAEDAEHCMISGLKLSCRTPLPRVVQVGAVSWLWRRVASPEYRRQIRFNLSAPLRGAWSSTHAPENSTVV